MALTSANLEGANLEQANFCGATWIDGDLCHEGSIGFCLKEGPNPGVCN
ncbi:pentapeptide repeat-containing protein [Zooshikella ganghwensis]